MTPDQAIPIPYSLARERAAACWPVLFSGRGIFSEAIKFFSHGEFSHASIIIRFPLPGAVGKRVYMVEALAGGLTFTLFSKRVAEYEGEVYLLEPLGLTPDMSMDGLDFALQELGKGKKYDDWTLFKNILGPAPADPEKYICSEFAQFTLEHMGLLEKRPMAATPSDLPQILPSVLYHVERDGDPWLGQWTGAGRR